MKRVQTGKHSHKWVKEPKDYVDDAINTVAFLVEELWHLIKGLSVLAFWIAYIVVIYFFVTHLFNLVVYGVTCT